MQLCLNLFKNEFIEIATKLSAVVACRCSPTQKADVARLIRHHTKKRVCCIGDGGNDVSMIQAADVGPLFLYLSLLTQLFTLRIGVGIVGKEGKQASLAADFSVTQFSFLTKLLLWHGRNSYRRSAKLAQFVIHRGLIISIMQAVFSAIFYFAPIALYQGWLMVGYATIYTMAPVFSLVLDRDVNEDLALLYPELYKELTKVSVASCEVGRWCADCFCRGIIGTSTVVQDVLPVVDDQSISRCRDYDHVPCIVRERVFAYRVDLVHGVDFERADYGRIGDHYLVCPIHLILDPVYSSLSPPLRHLYMVISEVVTLFLYAISIAFLPEYFGMCHALLLLPVYLPIAPHVFKHIVFFVYTDMSVPLDLSFVVTIPFAWKVAVIVGISAMPLWIIKLIRNKVKPSASSKLL